MAHPDFTAIGTRVREVLEGAGTIRQIPSGRFGGDLPEGLEKDEVARRSLADAKPTRIRLRMGPPHSGRLTVMGDVQVHHVDAIITVARGVYPEHQLNDDTREAIGEAHALDASYIAQAFEYPANLSQTADATATGIKGGVYQGAPRISPPTSAPGGAQVSTAEHTVRMTVRSRPATS